MTRVKRTQISGRCLKAAMVMLFAALVLATAVAPAQTTAAPNFNLLYSFHYATGEYPLAAMIVDSDGNLYGTTQNGGDRDLGTVFEISNAGQEIVLHSFKAAPDGRFPIASLVRDSAGNLYGTTSQGGAYGFGTVFEVDAAGKESVLYSFTGKGDDGRYPAAGLLLDEDGNLYGTTEEGGDANFGTVFKLAAGGSETVIHSFKGFPKDGEYPVAGLIRDDAGNLYGTTELGGFFNNGTIFKIHPTGAENLVFSFRGNRGGGYPFAGVVRDDEGNFYGTAAYGGFGIGTVCKVAKNGVETVLYTFSGGDGAYPSSGLVRDAKGNLYGTTEFGGDFGAGVVFEITKSGKELTIHSFDGSDGAVPLAAPTLDNSGNLYGVTTVGGARNQGTAFKLEP
jgi:uncharacterized repeat protein (TIGR03803 family)